MCHDPTAGVQAPDNKYSPGQRPQTHLVVIFPYFNVYLGPTHFIIREIPVMGPHPVVLEPLRHSGV